MADDEAVQVEETGAGGDGGDSIKYLVQIFREIGIKSQIESKEGKESQARETGDIDKEIETREELPQEPLPESPAPASAAASDSAPLPDAPAAAASALDFELSNQILPATEAPGKEQTAPLLARGLSQQAESPEATPGRDETPETEPVLARGLPQPVEQVAAPASPEPSASEAEPVTPVTPVEEETALPKARGLPDSELDSENAQTDQPATPVKEETAPLLARGLPRADDTEKSQVEPASSISFLVKIYKEANNLAEPSQKEQLDVAIEEISKSELEKLNLKPEDMSIKISAVDDGSAADSSSFGGDSTVYLVQIVKDVLSQAKAQVAPSIIEAIKIETAVLVASRDLPEKETEEVVQSIEHEVVVTTRDQPPLPIVIQEVKDKDQVDFQVDEASSVTYLVQIVNEILSQPPRYPHETEQPKPVEEDQLVIDRANHHALLSSQDDKLQDLTTSQISDGVDSLIDELNNQLASTDLEHELTSNAFVVSEDEFSPPPSLTRPAARDANLSEVAHEIVISAVNGAQSQLDSLTSPSLSSEFNKLGTVEYITRDQPIEFTADKPKVDTVNVSKPTFTKEYHVSVQGPKFTSTGKDLNLSLARPAIPAEPSYSYKEPGVSVTRPEYQLPSFSLSKDVKPSVSVQQPTYSFNNDIYLSGPSVQQPGVTQDFTFGLGKPEISMQPQFSVNKDVNFKPSVAIQPPPFSLTGGDSWSDLPTRDLPKVTGTGQLVIDAGISKPQFNTGYDTAQPVSSGTRFDPYEILRAYSTTSTEELLRNFNEELPGARQCRISGDPGSDSQFGVGYQENPAGPYSISNVKARAAEAGVREGDLIIAVNNVYVVGVSELELIVQFLEAKKSNELLLELIEPHKCPRDVGSVVSF